MWSLASLLLGLPFALALPSPLNKLVPPLATLGETVLVPIVIWHGLGDRYDAAGLLSLKEDLETRPQLKGVFVHIVEIGQDGAADQKATFFGNAHDQIDKVCQQLVNLPELTDPTLNPHGKFDAIGFSQGGQLLRGVVEKCGRPGGLRVRNLITLGSQHLGISALPPCPPGSSPFSPCRLMHLSLVHSSIYSSYAQNNIVPAQYFRNYANEEELKKYLSGTSFLREINNERLGDLDGGDSEARNETYRDNLKSLNKLVLFRFSDDVTVVPSTSAHFTLPSNASSPVPGSYDPLPLKDVALYSKDYIGLRAIDERGDLVRGVCRGVHMQIGKKCWDHVVKFLGAGGEKGPTKSAIWEMEQINGGESSSMGDGVDSEEELRNFGLVFQD